MAKRRYRRYRRKNGRWAPNIVKIAGDYNIPSGEFDVTEELARNPIQSNTGVAQTFTVKNVELTFTIESGTPQFLEAVTAYIMYVPQGMTVTPSYYAEHPEYIMAYKYLGSPTSHMAQSSAEIQNFQPIRIKTRLSRKLQTGDSVVLFVQGSNEYTSNLQILVTGIVRWWSKAN